MDRCATYIRALTDAQEPTRQRNAIDECLTKHDVGLKTTIDTSTSVSGGVDPGRKQFIELFDAILFENYDYIIMWEISRLARLGTISQRFFEHCGDTGTTVAITDGWIDEGRPDGTGRLIADISAAIAEEERRLLTKHIQAGVDRAQREGKWLRAVPEGFRRDQDDHLQFIHKADRDSDKVSYLEMRMAIERINNEEAYRSVAADTPNLA